MTHPFFGPPFRLGAGPQLNHVGSHPFSVFSRRSGVAARDHQSALEAPALRQPAAGHARGAPPPAGELGRHLCRHHHGRKPRGRQHAARVLRHLLRRHANLRRPRRRSHRLSDAVRRKLAEQGAHRATRQGRLRLLPDCHAGHRRPRYDRRRDRLLHRDRRAFQLCGHRHRLRLDGPCDHLHGHGLLGRHALLRHPDPQARPLRHARAGQAHGLPAHLHRRAVHRLRTFMAGG